MTLRHTILFALLLGSLSVAAQKTLPDVDLKTLDGQVVKLSSYAGKGHPVIISFWATWCSPCKKELDIYSELYEEWQENYGVEVVAITIDDLRALAKVGPMVKTKGWEFTVLSDSSENARQALNFQTVPQTFLVDAQGRIVYSHTGFVPGDEIEMEEKLAALKGR